MTTSGQPNRLIHETSPYLKQHAHNPVDWYPWGPEALERARREDKPIFLSIGYSTCHWCHVMAHESFEDENIAALMNKHFINIKVDREERPDLDETYMTAVQLMTGRGDRRTIDNHSLKSFPVAVGYGLRLDIFIDLSDRALCHRNLNNLIIFSSVSPRNCVWS